MGKSKVWEKAEDISIFFSNNSLEEAWYPQFFTTFKFGIIYFSLFQEGFLARNKKTLQKTWAHRIKNYFWHILHKISFETMKLLQILFFYKPASTHQFTYQPCYLITPRLRWHIYFHFHQYEINQELYNSLENNSFNLLSEITRLLTDSGRITIYDLGSREGLSAILCMPRIGLKCKVQKYVACNLLSSVGKTTVAQDNYQKNSSEIISLSVPPVGLVLTDPSPIILII